MVVSCELLEGLALVGVRLTSSNGLELSGSGCAVVSGVGRV